MSELYDIFSFENSHTLNSLQIKARWKVEGNNIIKQETWTEVCTKAHLATNSSLWREFKQKIITRFF